MWTTGVLLVLTHQLSQDKEHTFHFGDPWVNEVRLSPPLGDLFSPVFVGQWSQWKWWSTDIHWIFGWFSDKAKSVIGFRSVEVAWRRRAPSQSSMPIPWAMTWRGSLAATSGDLEFLNRCQQCLMFVFFNLSWVSWRITSSTKNPLRLHLYPVRAAGRVCQISHPLC